MFLAAKSKSPPARYHEDLRTFTWRSSSRLVAYAELGTLEGCEAEVLEVSMDAARLSALQILQAR